MITNFKIFENTNNINWKDIEKLLELISKDYQFDFFDDRFIGVLNINPQNYGSSYDTILMIKIVNLYNSKINKLLKLLDKYHLQIQGTPDKDEIIFETTYELYDWKNLYPEKYKIFHETLYLKKAMKDRNITQIKNSIKNGCDTNIIVYLNNHNENLLFFIAKRYEILLKNESEDDIHFILNSIIEKGINLNQKIEGYDFSHYAPKNMLEYIEKTFPNEYKNFIINKNVENFNI